MMHNIDSWCPYGIKLIVKYSVVMPVLLLGMCVLPFNSHYKWHHMHEAYRVLSRIHDYWE